MARYFVSGCNKPIALLGNFGFILDSIQLDLGCETKALAGAPSQPEAVERCRVCKHCVVDEYLQAPAGTVQPQPQPKLEPQQPTPPAAAHAELPAAKNWWELGAAAPSAAAPPELLVGVADDNGVVERPSLDDLLPPDAPRGASLFGNSKLRPFRRCLRRGFYEVVLGLKRPVEPERLYQGKVKLSALCLGQLVHELLRQHYLDRDWRKVLPPILDHYPKLADEALRLVEQHNATRAETDKDQWDVRFVEMESRLYLPARKVAGKGKGRGMKKISVCITSRHDLGVRVKQKHEPRLPPHEKAAQVWIADHKTIENVTRDATAAYAHDSQVLQNLACYRDGWCETPAGWRRSAEVYGPAGGFILNLIGKAVNHDPNSHLIRTRYTVPPAILDEYVSNTADWLYEELLPRLLGAACTKESTWPKGWDCRDPVTSQACPHMTLCEQGGIAKVNLAAIYGPPQPLDPQSLLAPEKPATRRQGRGKGRNAAAEVETK